MSLRDILPRGTEQGGEGGEWSPVASGQWKEQHNKYGEGVACPVGQEPRTECWKIEVCWHLAMFYVPCKLKVLREWERKKLKTGPWEESEVSKDRTLNWAQDVECELNGGAAACKSAGTGAIMDR